MTRRRGKPPGSSGLTKEEYELQCLLRNRDFQTEVIQAAVAAGIRDLRQHDLRHVFAIRRLRGGANLVAVSALLRHSSTRMSERYLHVTRDDLRAAVEAGQPSPTGTATGTDVEGLLQSIDFEGRD